jgi:hypothetical protein
MTAKMSAINPHSELTSANAAAATPGGLQKQASRAAVRSPTSSACGPHAVSCNATKTAKYWLVGP